MLPLTFLPLGLCSDSHTAVLWLSIQTEDVRVILYLMPMFVFLYDGNQTSLEALNPRFVSNSLLCYYVVYGCSSVDQPDVADCVFTGLDGPVS